MIPLGTSLDDINFDALLAIAREPLPQLAPDWTDYNYSDPGITLIELLCWIADSQIYSVGRNRLDERMAMAALLGVRPRGAQPARGVLYPDIRPDVVGPIARGSLVKPALGGLPPVETASDVTIQPADIVQVAIESAAGVQDVTAINDRPRAPFAPFVRPDATLRLRIAPVTTSPLGRTLSIGFELSGAPPSSAISADIARDLVIRQRTSAGDELPVAIEYDTTCGLQRGGVLRLELPVDPAPDFDLAIRLGPSPAIAPRIVRIALNALPVVQQMHIARSDLVVPNGRVGQSAAIEIASLIDADAAGGPTPWRLCGDAGKVRFALSMLTGDGPQPWRRVSDFGLAAAEPVYRLTERGPGEAIDIAFGNGVNGLRPALGGTMEAAFALSCGERGNAAPGSDWLLDFNGSRWHNREAIAGGANADELSDLFARLNTDLTKRRTLATDRQVADAALALPSAIVPSRATIEAGWRRGRGRTTQPATRTLIVSRRDIGESPGWRRAIARSLAPRIAIGERLIVASPVYRDVVVVTRITAARGRKSADIETAVRKLLEDVLTPSGSRGADWPLGQGVTAAMLEGWIRNVDGVAQADVTMEDGGGKLLDPAHGLVVGRGELPRLRDARITVEAAR